MNALVFLPDRNTIEHDWSGAFLVEARRFADLHGLPTAALVQVDVSRPFERRRAPVLAALAQAQELDAVIFLCHGWSKGVQLGFTTRSVAFLAEGLRGCCRPELAVALYACSTGAGTEDGDGTPGGEGGFADALRDALLPVAPGCHVDAHTVLGHCSRNPYVRRFEASTPLGGDWIVAPDDPAFAGWRRRLRDTDLRLRFPLLSREAIQDELGTEQHHDRAEGP